MIRGFRVEPDIARMQQTLNFIGRDQVPYATALALTRTAKFVEGEIRKEMPRTFRSPTRFTLNALRTAPATKQKLVAEVKVKDESFKAVAPIKWLSPQIYGGPRTAKRFEERLRTAGILGANQYAMPGQGAKMDGNGNMSRGQIVAILSDLQAHWDKAQNTTQASRAKRGARRKRGGVYFVVRTQTGRLRPGVYERTAFAFGSAVKPVLIFTGQPRYRKRLRFFEVAEAVSPMRFRLELKRAAREAMRTARVR